MSLLQLLYHFLLQQVLVADQDLGNIRCHYDITYIIFLGHYNLHLRHRHQHLTMIVVVVTVIAHKVY